MGRLFYRAIGGALGQMEYFSGRGHRVPRTHTNNFRKWETLSELMVPSFAIRCAQPGVTFWGRFGRKGPFLCSDSLVCLVDPFFVYVCVVARVERKGRVGYPEMWVSGERSRFGPFLVQM